MSDLLRRSGSGIPRWSETQQASALAAPSSETTVKSSERRQTEIPQVRVSLDRRENNGLSASAPDLLHDTKRTASSRVADREARPSGETPRASGGSSRTSPNISPTKRSSGAPLSGLNSPKKIASQCRLTDPEGRVHVFTRVRPPLTGGPPQGEQSCVRALPGLQQIVHRGPVVGERTFYFDGVFDEHSSQEEVYAAVGRPVLHDVLEGMHGCIMAYGQTGSGKTYSLLETGAPVVRSNSAGDLQELEEEIGAHDEAGLFPRLISELFVTIAADFENVYEVTVSMFQIYNEQVDDLLDPDNQNLRIRQEQKAGQSGWYVEGLTWLECSCPEALMMCFSTGRQHLRYAETHMNKHSSRSHAVMQLQVSRRRRLTEDEEAAPQAVVKRLLGRMLVVDLAGSERVKKSQPNNTSGLADPRFKEAANINTSLLAIGNVVQALAKGHSHVPFRDSCLTRLMEGSLGGTCRTALLVCVAPEMYHSTETCSTMEFATRAIGIAAKPTVFEETQVLDPKALASGLGAAYRIEALEKAEKARRSLENRLAEVEERSNWASSHLEEARHAEAQLEGQLAESMSSVAQLRRELASEKSRREMAERRERHAGQKLEELKQHYEHEMTILKVEQRRALEAKEQDVKNQAEAISRLQSSTGEERANLMLAIGDANRACAKLVLAQQQLDEATERKADVERQLALVTSQLTAAQWKVADCTTSTEGQTSAPGSSVEGGGPDVATTPRSDRQVSPEKARVRAMVEEAEFHRQKEEVQARHAQAESSLEQARQKREAQKIHWDAQQLVLESILGHSATSGRESDVTAPHHYISAVKRVQSESAARIARLESQLVNTRQLASLSESVLNRQVERCNTQLAATNQRATRLQVQLDAVSVDLAAAEDDILAMEKEIEMCDKDIDQLEADLRTVQEMALRNGAFFNKRGRNGKLNRRLVRWTASSQLNTGNSWRQGVKQAGGLRIEWAAVSKFHHSMATPPQTSPFAWVGDEVVLQGPDRPLTLKLTHPEQRLWVQILELKLKELQDNGTPSLSNKSPPPATASSLTPQQGGGVGVGGGSGWSQRQHHGSEWRHLHAQNMNSTSSPGISLDSNSRNKLKSELDSSTGITGRKGSIQSQRERENRRPPRNTRKSAEVLRALTSSEAVPFSKTNEQTPRRPVSLSHAHYGMDSVADDPEHRLKMLSGSSVPNTRDNSLDLTADDIQSITKELKGKSVAEIETQASKDSFPARYGIGRGTEVPLTNSPPVPEQQGTPSTATSKDDINRLPEGRFGFNEQDDVDNVCSVSRVEPLPKLQENPLALEVEFELA